MTPSLLRADQDARLRWAGPVATARLILRPVTVEDITPVYIDALNDPEVVRWTEARHLRWNRAQVARWIERCNAPGASLLIGSFLRESGRHIGNTRLFNIHPVHRRAELSLIVFDKSQWSKGYAAEAVDAVTAYAFGALGLHRIHADYYAPNAASARLFVTLGFAIEGVYRDHFFVDGVYVDSVRVAKLSPARQASRHG